MTTLTTTQRRARADAIIAESGRTGCSTLTAIKRVKSRLFGETAPSTPAARPAAGRLSDKAIRKIIDRKVTEALTAAGAPSLPAGVQMPGMPKAPNAPRAPALPPLHQMSGEEIAAATIDGMTGGASPFWRKRQESAPAATTLTESAAALSTPLDKLSPDELAAEFGAYITEQGRDRGFGSPIWAA